MKSYVLGFLFNASREQVVLQVKTHGPPTACGLNGIGGAVKPDETALAAIGVNSGREDAMRLYEVINMSDCVTFEAPDDTVAGVVGLLLGHGQYAVQDQDGQQALPLFLFGGVQDWLREHGIEPVDGAVASWAHAHRDEVIAAFRSCAVCSLSDRAALRAATNGDHDAIRRWNEAKRTSLNDICGRATLIADRLAADASADVPTPRQVLVS